MGNSLPLVHAACICEKVLLEKDNAASLIRIIDTITAHIPKDVPPDARAGFPITAFIRLGSGDLSEKGKVAIHPRRPDGTKGGRFEVDVELGGGAKSAQLKIGFHVVKPQDGVYWFDVFWNDSFLTSVPLTVKLAVDEEATEQSPAPQTIEPA